MNIEKCFKFFANFANKTILVGFSGGADSTAALLVAHYFQKSLNYKLIAVHFNHHLRGEISDLEAKNARIFANKLNIEFIVIDLDLSNEKNNIENAARLARLNEWEKFNKIYEDFAVVTGHHNSDRIENLLLRLGRGGNSSALSSMRTSSVVKGVNFIRPLLEFSRADIELFLKENSIDNFAIDQSNYDCKYQRNYLRNKLLPEWNKHFPTVISGLNEALNVLELDALFLEEIAQKEYKKIIENEKVYTKSFLDLNLAIYHRVLRLYLSELRKTDTPISRQLSERFREFCQYQGCESRKILVDNISIVNRKGVLSLHKEQSIPSPKTWQWELFKEINFAGITLKAEVIENKENLKISHNEAIFAKETLPKTLIIRLAKDGETMLPFGREHFERVKKLRTDKKISQSSTILLDDNNDNIIWLIGIRHSNHYTISKDTKEIIKISIIS